MTVQEYRQRGFSELSSLIDQAAIDRAERDVTEAYIIPIAGDDESDDVTDCRCNLAVLLVMQRSLFATRSGAKEKTTPQSYTADRWNILSQSTATCVFKLAKLAKAYGISNAAEVVSDICGLYFQTQYFNF